ncbi:RNA demethylase ALKBH9B-like [Juglans microcarpa x Juglans regia]|uniref:RNA demethylase ALKBH9B-like n=1 Tax=Juglans microcarpa x Juglans regia TaxID=2249226 RepID=UPI001B7F59B8|nr:RNA demethylase ALKBH9B-like [Juglans microcarpa x Juglans regia]
MDDRSVPPSDPLLLKFEPSELRTASEFLTTWLPFLSRDLCPDCSQTLSDRVRSLGHELDADAGPERPNENSDPLNSDIPKLQQEVNQEVQLEVSDDHDENCDTNSIGSWKDGWSGPVAREQSTSGSPSHHRMSWADIAQEEEDEFGEEEKGEVVEEAEEDSETTTKRVVDVNAATGKLRISMKAVEKPKTNLSREQREYTRFMNVKRVKDFICLERFRGKIVNILEGLELHTGIFSAAEQKRIVDTVYIFQEKGRKGELKERTYTAPTKWMRGKGRVTIQFGCCYNYATDKNGNPPGILHDNTVDPMPYLFKMIIKRLVKWHVLPPTCVPDSCIVNIYEEGDCIPPHIDNHDFVRPFCTVSFLSECNIIFGSNLKILGPGDFDGAIAIPLPVGSVLVLNGNGADVAKHCVPAVPTKRISITFRRMDESKRPIGYVEEPDLLDIQPLPYQVEKEKRLNAPKPDRYMKQSFRRPVNMESRGPAEGSDTYRRPHESSWRPVNTRSRGPAEGGDTYREPRESNWSRGVPPNRRREG